MTVLSVENAGDSLKGWLCRYLYQVRPGIYVGNISGKIRDLIWKNIMTTPDIEAALLWDNNTEQGFSSKIKGDPRRKIEDIEGLQWITIEKVLSHLSFKAKKDTKKELICHLLETGTITKVLFQDGLLFPLKKRLAELMRENENDVINFICFVAALHDIGKIHPHFQMMIENDNELLHGFNIHDTQNFRHEQYGEFVLKTLDSPYFNSLPEKRRKAAAEMIALHHLGHDRNNYYEPWGDGSELITDIQKEVVEICFKAFPFKFVHTKTFFCNNGVLTIISAIINFSDWIASSDGVFDETQYSKQDGYLKHLEEQAYRFLENNYMLYIPNEYRFRNVSDYNAFYNIYGITNKRPLQDMVYENCQRSKGGTLMFLEAPCGEGKTVAALFAATHLNPDANGFYMALPTAATSESIHEEVAVLCENASPSLKLPVFNGRSWLSDKDITLDRSLWLAPSRQKMFYPFSVGTVDQLISSVLKEKFGILRLLACMGKTIIIDEMHAYDLYMKDALKIFLQYCGIFQVSVIILSATLLTSTKEELISAYTGYLPEESKERKYAVNGKEQIYNGKWNLSNDYPLITMVTGVKYRKQVSIYESAFDASKKQNYLYELVHLKEDDVMGDAIANSALKKVENGGCLAVIVNTVDEARNIYRKICEIKDDDTDVFLMHGRNTINNKEKSVENVKKLFGKDRSNRPQKAIVVSTQIIEQSMDVDFDFMFTELAPIDLLIQRFGRYHRHENCGTIREYIKSDDKISVLVPNRLGIKKISMIYNSYVINQTLQTLEQYKDLGFHLPKDTRALVESAYSSMDSLSSKDIKKHFAAQYKTISNPKNGTFDYYTAARELKSRVETRYSDCETMDIAIVPTDTFEALKAGNVDPELAKSIMKSNVVTSVPKYLLFSDDKDLFSDEQTIKAGQLNGYLRNLTIYCENDSGWVTGEARKMIVDEVYGLVMKKEVYTK